MNNLDEMEEMTNVLLENRYDLHENQNTKKNNNNKIIYRNEKRYSS